MRQCILSLAQLERALDLELEGRIRILTIDLDSEDHYSCCIAATEQEALLIYLYSAAGPSL